MTAHDTRPATAPGGATALPRPLVPSWLDQAGLGLTLALPLFLTHGRGLAEASIDLLAAGLLLRSALGRDWSWISRPWLIVSAMWWVWQCVCSTPLPPFGTGGLPSMLQAVAACRFLLLAAALEAWTLRDPRARLWLRRLLIGCCLYIGGQVLVQAVFGYNLFGYPRFHDGTLTGPYGQPRAMAPLSRLMVPSVMAGCAVILAFGRGAAWRLSGAVGCAGLGLAVMVWGGQRMPLLLTLLGFFICALFWRPFRPAALACAVLLPVLVALISVVSPGSFFHLVILARQQAGHFAASPYGLIAIRALAMAFDDLDTALTGLGYDAFRHGCADPRFFHGAFGLTSGLPDEGGAAFCVQHAHNHYLEALTNAGLPGLGLFCAMIAVWLWTLWPRRGASAWAIGLFAAVVMQEWPFGPSSDFLNLPLGGWALLLFGTGLAEAAARTQAGRGRVPSHIHAV